MRFGHFFYPMNFDGARDPEVIDECLYEAELVEELGLDAIWLAEHHFTGEDICYPIDTKNSGTHGRWDLEAVDFDDGSHGLVADASSISNWTLRLAPLCPMADTITGTSVHREWQSHPQRHVVAHLMLEPGREARSLRGCLQSGIPNLLFLDGRGSR